MGVILFLLFGLVVGLVARALLPGRQTMGLLATILLGCGGSFVGGFLGNLLAGRDVTMLTSAGFFGSLAGALIVLLLLTPMMRRRRGTV